MTLVSILESGGKRIRDCKRTEQKSNSYQAQQSDSSHTSKFKEWCLYRGGKGGNALETYGSTACEELAEIVENEHAEYS